MNSEKDKIFVFGASGHAKVVIDIIERERRFDIVFLVDDDPSLKGTDFYGYRVIGGKSELVSSRKQIVGGIVAIGNNRARMNVAAWLIENGFSLVTTIHPSAQIGRGTHVGNGSVVMAGAVINSDASIGANTIINTRASIDHDCKIGNEVHVAPGATLCGSVTVGDETFVCAGATIIPNLIVGKNVIVGAGSTVISDVPEGITVVGNPAK
ncbi:MAG: acetyltransferase [Desulfuromonadales bacterium]|nr:acetyltransferase [Desulfuromonadales bacterium]